MCIPNRHYPRDVYIVTAKMRYLASTKKPHPTKARNHARTHNLKIKNFGVASRLNCAHSGLKKTHLQNSFDRMKEPLTRERCQAAKSFVGGIQKNPGDSPSLTQSVRNFLY